MSERDRSIPKVRAVKILVHRAEGKSHECEPREFTGEHVWHQAGVFLAMQARTAPHPHDQMGADKTDFTVTYDDADGTTYSGTLMLTQTEFTLATHIRGFLTHVIAEREHYEAMGTNVDECVHFLANYEIGAS